MLYTGVCELNDSGFYAEFELSLWNGNKLFIPLKVCIGEMNNNMDQLRRFLHDIVNKKPSFFVYELSTYEYKKKSDEIKFESAGNVLRYTVDDNLRLDIKDLLENDES